MKKILFNDKFGLTAAVLAGTKTQTRRIITGVLPEIQELRVINNVCEYKDPYTKKWYKCNFKHQPKYKVGEVVAVAQRYKDMDVFNILHFKKSAIKVMQEEGYHNKMFVKADLMPHRIEITDIRVQRLQDISDADCLAEGILKEHVRLEYDEPQDTVLYSFQNSNKLKPMPKTSLAGYFDSPKAAYAALIDKISGKGTWERNPWTFVYNFQLIKK